MEQFYFIGILAVFLSGSIALGFKFLPKENWQIIAVVPKEKSVHGKWKGLNLTYYGILCANAYTFAVIIFVILSGSVHMPLPGLTVLIALLLAVCMPAAKIIARIVEKKTGTLTVGGAVFAGTIISPFLVLGVNRFMGIDISVTVFLSAVSVAYAFGEGLGRLACISFGCCYGKPLSQCSPWLQKLFSNFYLIFTGDTKKIAYASGLEGQKVIPIQVITAILYSICGLVGTVLFLNGHFVAALMQSLIITQLWRFVSEFFRADFRGKLTITPYQIMSIITLIYAACIALFMPGQATVPTLMPGLDNLWSPGIILMIQAIWVITFLYTGRSSVTGAEVSLHVVQEKI